MLNKFSEESNPKNKKEEKTPQSISLNEFCVRVRLAVVCGGPEQVVRAGLKKSLIVKS